MRTRVMDILKEYKEIIILLAAIGAVGTSDVGRKALGTSVEPSLSVRVESIARNVDVLVKLQCMRDREHWDELSLAGIQCARLVNAR